MTKSVNSVQLIGLNEAPEVTPGMDLARVIVDATRTSDLRLRDDDILIVTHKVVSKAEGRLVDLRDVQPSDLARRFAEQWGKDARHVEVVLRESARIVRMDRGVIITQTRHGFVCANAGVDASNVRARRSSASRRWTPTPRRCPPRGDPARTAPVAVIITDSFGRPWRNGIVNVAIGVAGIQPLVDYRGQPTTMGG